MVNDLSQPESASKLIKSNYKMTSEFAGQRVSEWKKEDEIKAIAIQFDEDVQIKAANQVAGDESIDWIDT